ncbi:hypothetical protein NB706_003343 [Xanthomonas sacchari]|nr:hypothetical protein [Xanthomonas sacchari]
MERARHEHPSAARDPDQPDRRRRSGRASGLCRQGTGGERAGRRCAPRRHRSGRRRRAPDPHPRRRWRHRARGTAAGHLAARDQQDRLAGRPGIGGHARVSRRSVAVDRLGQPLHPGLAPIRRRTRRSAAGRRRQGRRGAAARIAAGHPGRGPRAVLQRAGAAQVPARRTHRTGPHRGVAAFAGAGAPRRGAARLAQRQAVAALQAGRSVLGRAPGRDPGRRLRKAGAARGPQRCRPAPAWLDRAAALLARQRRPAIPLRQRPFCARSQCRSCGEDGLRRCAVPWPPAGLCAVPGTGTGAGGRQRASGQARGAFPRCAADP